MVCLQTWHDARLVAASARRASRRNIRERGRVHGAHWLPHGRSARALASVGEAQGRERALLSRGRLGERTFVARERDSRHPRLTVWRQDSKHTTPLEPRPARFPLGRAGSRRWRRACSPPPSSGSRATTCSSCSARRALARRRESSASLLSFSAPRCSALRAPLLLLRLRAPRRRRRRRSRAAGRRVRRSRRRLLVRRGRRRHRRRQRRLVVGLLLPVVLVLATARGAAGVERAATAGRSARPRRPRPLPLR